MTVVGDADDIVFISDSSKEINKVLTILANTVKQWKLKININKTKVMIEISIIKNGKYLVTE